MALCRAGNQLNVRRSRKGLPALRMRLDEQKLENFRKSSSSPTEAIQVSTIDLVGIRYRRPWAPAVGTLTRVYSPGSRLLGALK